MAFGRAVPGPFRAISSAGERPPYKRRVGGSNPSSPTIAERARQILKIGVPARCFACLLCVRLGAGLLLAAAARLQPPHGLLRQGVERHHGLL